jgi:ATP-dependent protease ClpP protease subunit
MAGRLRMARPVAQLRQGRNDWYRISNSIGASTATIYVYDEIGYWGVTASDFVAELTQLNVASIDVHLNSPGGEIFDGMAIYEALRAHPAQVTTYVDSLAASIASVIAMAGDRIVIAPFGEMMIHDGSGLCIGNAADMVEMAELLDRQSNKIAAVYAARAGGTVEEWRALMTAETWFSAAEAVEAGLADEVSGATAGTDGTNDGATTTPVQSASNSSTAQWDLSIFTYPNRAAAPGPLANTAEPTVEVQPAPAPDAPSAPAPEVAADAEAQPELVTPEPAPVATEPDPLNSPAPADQADDWASITAHLTNPTVPSTEDVLARLREALT